MFTCSFNCIRFKSKGNLLCLLSQKGQLQILQFEHNSDNQAATGGASLPFKLEPLMVQKKVQSFWFSSCNEYIICQDRSQVLIVIHAVTRSVFATLPLFKEIKGFHTVDDLVVATLTNGSLLPLLILGNQNLGNNHAKLEQIERSEEPKPTKNDEYLNKMNDLLMGKRLNTFCSVKPNEQTLENTANKPMSGKLSPRLEKEDQISQHDLESRG